MYMLLTIVYFSILILIVLLSLLAYYNTSPSYYLLTHQYAFLGLLLVFLFLSFVFIIFFKNFIKELNLSMKVYWKSNWRRRPLLILFTIITVSLIILWLGDPIKEQKYSGVAEPLIL
mgnify:FL=1